MLGILNLLEIPDKHSQSNLEAHTVDQCIPGDILPSFQFIVISIAPNTIPCVEFKSRLLCVLDLSAHTVLHLDAPGFPIVFWRGFLDQGESRDGTFKIATIFAHYHSLISP